MRTPSMKHSRNIVGCLVVLMLLTACGASMPSWSKKSRANDFVAATKTYAKLIRWGYFDEAAKYIRARDDSPIDIDLARVSRYRVSSYKPFTQLLADNGMEGRNVAMIEYYEIDSGVIKTLRDEQIWWFDSEAERWFLASPLPGFGIAQEL